MESADVGAAGDRVTGWEKHAVEKNSGVTTSANSAKYLIMFYPVENCTTNGVLERRRRDR